MVFSFLLAIFFPLFETLSNPLASKASGEIFNNQNQSEKMVSGDSHLSLSSCKTSAGENSKSSTKISICDFVQDHLVHLLRSDSRPQPSFGDPSSAGDACFSAKSPSVSVALQLASECSDNPICGEVLLNLTLKFAAAKPSNLHPSQKEIRFSVFGLISFRPYCFHVAQFNFRPKSSIGSIQAHLSYFFGQEFKSPRLLFVSALPPYLLFMPRSDLSSLLFFLSQTLCRVIETIDQGRLLEHNSPLLLVWYKIYLGTLPVNSHKRIIHEVNRLKKNGIMIPSPRSGGYRCFFNPFYPFPLNIDFKQVYIINFIVCIHEIESLRKNGIMIPSPRSGGYQSFLSSLSPNPSDFRPVTTHLLADEHLHLAVLVPARTSVLDPSSTSPRLSTVTTLSSIDSLVENHSTNRDLTCAIMLLSLCLKALMDFMSFHFIYHVLALGNASFNYVLNFVIFESLFLVLGLI